MQSLTSIGAALVATIALGCAGPVQHGTVGATTAIQAAVDAGAARDRHAAVYLQYARNDLDTANRYGADTDIGSRALERSEVNAELALAMTRGARLTAESSYQQCKMHELRCEVCGTCGKETSR